jgi:hypothetical protein
MKRFVLGILIIGIIVAIVAVLTGFISLRTEGELRTPTVDINATGGELPKVDVDTKEVVVGTTNASVGDTQLKVPVIGIRDGEGDQNAAQAQPNNQQ